MRCDRLILVLLLGGLMGCGSRRPGGENAADNEAIPGEIVIIEEMPAEDHADAGDEGLTQTQIVQRDVRRIQTAMVEGDLDTVIGLTHPAATEEAGSDEELRQVLEEVIDLFAARDVKLESLEFPEDPAFFAGEENDFVFVPVLTIWTMKGDRFSNLGFQLGARPHGTADWKYLDDSNINADNVDEYFSDFPDDQPFPEAEMKKLDSPMEEKLEEAALGGPSRRS